MEPRKAEESYVENAPVVLVVPGVFLYGSGVGVTGAGPHPPLHSIRCESLANIPTVASGVFTSENTTVPYGSNYRFLPLSRG